MKKQKGRCHYCDVQMTRSLGGKYHATEDHILPRSKGGKDLYDNLVGACHLCNNMRGSIPYDTFKAYIGMHGNSRPIREVFKSLTREEYERGRSVYDVIRHEMFRQHYVAPPQFETMQERVHPRRPYLRGIRNKIAPIVLSIPKEIRAIYLSEEGMMECQTPPSQYFLTTTTSGSHPPATMTASM